MEVATPTETFGAVRAEEANRLAPLVLDMVRRICDPSKVAKKPPPLPLKKK